MLPKLLMSLLVSADGGPAQIPCSALEAAVATRGKYSGSVRDFAIVEAELRQVWPDGAVPVFAAPARSIAACSGTRYEVRARKPRSTYLAVEARTQINGVLFALRVSRPGTPLFNGMFCLRVEDRSGVFVGSHADPSDCAGMLLWN